MREKIIITDAAQEGRGRVACSRREELAWHARNKNELLAIKFVESQRR